MKPNNDFLIQKIYKSDNPIIIIKKWIL